MRHASVQVRGLLTRDELERYNALMDVGHFLEEQGRYDLAAVVQREIDLLVRPAIGRLKEKAASATWPTRSTCASTASADTVRTRGTIERFGAGRKQLSSRPAAAHSASMSAAGFSSSRRPTKNGPNSAKRALASSKRIS